MTTLPLIVIGIVFGLVAAGFATLMWAAAKARGSRASAIVLALGALLYFWLPFAWIPTPSRIAEAANLLHGNNDTVLYAVVIAATAVIGYLAAWRTGLVRRIRARLDSTAHHSQTEHT